MELKAVPSQNLIDFPKYSGEVKANWRKMIVGDSDESVAHSEAFLQRARSWSDYAEPIWNTLKNDITMGCSYVYGESDPTVITSYYEKLSILAKAWGTVGGGLYRNADLLCDIKAGLEYGYAHFYGEEVIAKGKSGNWWDWRIGVPLYMNYTLAIIEDELEYEDIIKYLSCFDRLVPYVPESSAGANKVWYCYCVIGASLLEGDGARMLRAQKTLKQVFDYTGKGDGYYIDGTYLMHTYHPNNGGYGLVLIMNLSEVMAIFEGTRYEIEDEKLNNQFDWIFNAYQPVAYGANLFSSVSGHDISLSSEYGRFGNLVKTMLNMTLYAPEEYKSRLESLIRTYMKSAGSDFTSYASLPLIDYAAALYNDDSVPLRESYNICKSFGMMAKVVQQNEKYAVSLSFSTTDIAKYEAIADRNMYAWYYSDGATDSALCILHRYILVLK